MILLAYLFLEIPAPKIWLDKCLKFRVSEDPQTDNNANGWKHFCVLNIFTFTRFINHCEGNWIRKNSLLVIHKIVRLFVNTLAVDENHYLLIRDNLTETIQIQLSQKKKAFFQFFLRFLKSILNFKHFPTKDDPRTRCISGNTGS